MKYFDQFNWPVINAFADALGGCQFGEGDVLFPNESNYPELYCIQVMYPARQMNVPKDEITVVFENNWGAEVRLQKYLKTEPGATFVATKEGGLIVSTQGRLYTALWKGDLSILDMSSEDPVMPTVDARACVRQIEISPEIKEKGKVVQKRVTTTHVKKAESAALNESKGSVVFAMPYDRSNNVSLQKNVRIRSALKNDLTEIPIYLTPKQAGIDDWKLFLPTVYIALFITPELSVEQLHEKIKKATYVKSKKTKTEKYDIAKHGEIFSS